MPPEIFQLTQKYCCLIYGDNLVVNLPVDKVEECMAQLDLGREYEYPLGVKRSYADFMNTVFRNVDFLAKAESRNILHKEWPVSVAFKLDEKFCLQVNDGARGKIFLDREKNHIIANANRKAYPGSADDDTFWAWLDAALLKRGFGKIKSMPSKKRFGLESAGGVIIMFIIALVVTKNLFSFPLYTRIMVSIVIAVVGSALFILWELRSPPNGRTKYFLK